jgi:hypothetical protein
MRLTTLLFVATVAAFSTAGEVYADAISLNDGRYVRTDIDGYSFIDAYHLHQTVSPSGAFLPFTWFLTGSYQNSQMSGLNFTSTNRIDEGFYSPNYSFVFQLRSVFDIVFQLTEFHEFQTSAQLWVHQEGTATQMPQIDLSYYLTGPSGDVFRYAGDPFAPSPDNFQAGGLLAPGTYRLYGESKVGEGRASWPQLYNVYANLDFSMSLTPVPEGGFPLWLLAVLASILLFRTPFCYRR